MLTSLESLINQACFSNPKAQKILGSLDGKVVQITLTDVGVSFCMRLDKCGAHLVPTHHPVAHTHISGSSIAILRRAIDKDTFQGLDMEGSIEVGQQCKALLDSLEIDWEENLSQWIGDAPAHYSVQLVKSVWEKLKAVRTELQQNVTEYVQEETRLAPTRHEQETFQHTVRALRHDVERLEHRVHNLRFPPSKRGS